MSVDAMDVDLHTPMEVDDIVTAPISERESCMGGMHCQCAICRAAAKERMKIHYAARVAAIRMKRIAGIDHSKKRQECMRLTRAVC